MTKFTETYEYKKGLLGENLVQKFLEDKNFVVYKPVTDAAHSFDFMFHKNGIKHKLYFAEVKTKPSMFWNWNRTPANVTGINTKHLTEYAKMIEQNNQDLFIYFVDERLKRCYGQFVSVLLTKWSKEINDSRKNQSITVWSVNDMNDCFTLTLQMINYLKK